MSIFSAFTNALKIRARHYARQMIIVTVLCGVVLIATLLAFGYLLVAAEIIIARHLDPLGTALLMAGGLGAIAVFVGLSAVILGRRMCMSAEKINPPADKDREHAPLTESVLACSLELLHMAWALLQERRQAQVSKQHSAE